jgi:hypothetical protein
MLFGEEEKASYVYIYRYKRRPESGGERRLMELTRGILHSCLVDGRTENTTRGD